MRFWLAILACTLPASLARAEIFRYLDSRGVWHFANHKKHSGYKKWLVGHEKFELDDTFAEVLGSGPFDDLFVEAGKRTMIPPALLKAVAAQESGFNPQAVSPVGAMGLMQLMPATAKMLSVDNAFDPEQAVFGGARFLRMMLDAFANDVTLAVAAYNCGEGNVRRAMAVPQIEETQDYVVRVMRFYTQFGGEPAQTKPMGDFYEADAR